MSKNLQNLPALAIIVPDGVGVKDFIYGKFCHELVKNYKLHIFHAVSPEHLDFLPTIEGVQYHKLLKPSRNFLEYFIGQVLFFMHIHENYTPGRKFQNTFKLQGSRHSVIFRRFCDYASKLFASRNNLKRLDNLYYKCAKQLPEVKLYQKLFKELKIEALFSTHQRPRMALPPTLAARENNIPAISFISSWDNVSSKGRIIIPFDYFCVWNHHMATEMQRFYPDIPSSKVFVTGTNHFASPDKPLSREVFCDKIGLDKNRPFIYISTGRPSLLPKEHIYTKIVLDAIRQGLVDSKVQVVVRPSPGHREERFDNLMAEYPELIVARPKWTQNQAPHYAPATPYPEDLLILDALNRYCNLNINTLSTMTLDVAIFDNPVINFFFDIVNEDESKSIRMLGFANMDHIQLIINSNATKLATSPKNLIEAINIYLKDKTLHRQERREMVSFHTEDMVDSANANIANVITKILQKSK